MNHNLWIALCLILSLAACGQISSWDTRVSYAYDGKPLSYNLYFKLELGMGATDYLRILWPETIHVASDKTAIKVTLISQENSYQITQVSCAASPADTTPEYFVTFGTSLDAGKWYQIQIYPTSVPTLTQGLIQMQSVSDTGANYISYDQNFAFGYYYIQTGAIPATLGVSVSSTSTNKNKPYQIYTTTIELTPTVSSSSGGNFTVFLYYDGSNAQHLASGTTLLDFSFAGICQSVIPPSCPSCTAAVLNYCTISTDLSTITFSASTVTANTPIAITTQVQNPVYVSTRGVRAYWVNFVSGLVVQNGLMAAALAVNSIAVTTPGTDRVKFFWGIRRGYTDSTNYLSNVPIGIYKATSVGFVGPLNSFNNGFMIAQTPPIDAVFTVKMTLSADGILEGSIVHNLPAASGKSVYCSYTSPSIICQNVGAFINTNFRYFISGKAYYSSSTPSTLTTFGDVQILSVVYDTSGNMLSSVSLFSNFVSGESVTVTASEEFLDSGGWHSTSNRQGYTRIVSYADDLTLSSTANAISGYYTGSNATVGIIPDLANSQQLLFLLNVPITKMDTGASNNAYTMKILYNSKVIGFQTGASGLGLDFAGYSTTLSAWSKSSASCFEDAAIMCQKYDNDGNQSMNAQYTVNDASSNSLYGIFIFNCGDPVNTTTYCGASCKTHCQIFKGYSASNTYGGVVSMRRVTFPTGYHSQLYADDNLLDFVVSFYHNSNLVSTTLINAYTIEASRMANIKYSYVNYYDNGASIYNKGVRIPMMARIGGGVLPTESLGATVVAVFFDQNMDARTFLTGPTTNYSIGCSTGSCLYYPNVGVNVPRDIWHCSDRVEFYNLPSIQNEFNLLVPITQKVANPPRSMNIAFMSQNYTIDGVTGLLRVLSVYRLFGPAVVQSIQGSSIGTLNGVTASHSGLASMDMTADSWSYTGTFSYAINTTNIKDSPPNNTIFPGTNTVATTYLPNGSYYGAGITITSFNYNIFAAATVKFNSPPASTATTCSIFSYLYTEMVAGNAQRTGRYVHVAFCPIDSQFSLGTASANLVLGNPQYPSYFVTGFPLKTVIAYAYSDNTGVLRAYNLETTAISYTRSCTTSKLQMYYPQSRRQRASFSVSFSEILMGNVPKGYPSIKFVLTIPSTTVPSSSALSISTSSCQIVPTYLTCAVTAQSTTVYTITASLSGGDANTYSLRSVTFRLYADSTAVFGVADNYTIAMSLPQSTTSTPLVYGSDYTTSSSMCTGSSLFTVATTPYLTTMNFNNFTYESVGRSIRGKFSVNFGASSYRDIFFTTSYFEFNLGFLTTPNTALKTAGNFRCVIFNNDSTVVSTLWKKFDLTSLASAKLYSKAEITNPNSMLFSLVCYGGSMPDGSTATSMSLKWVDSSYDLQTSSTLASPAFVASSAFSTAPTLPVKRFNVQGSLGFYCFQITSSAALDQNSRIYFEFPFKIPSSTNREQQLECYTNSASSNNDGTATYTYCSVVGQRRIVVWNNRVVAAGGNLFVEIFGIAQPKVGDISTSSSIAVILDLDSQLANGASQYGTVAQKNLNAAATNNIIINSATMSSTYIRSLQDISLSFTFAAAGKLTASRNLYVVFPASYAIWIKRSDTLTTTNCILKASGSSTNLATACTFISQRLLKVTSNADAGTSYTLDLKDIKSSPYVPTDMYNEIRFYLFLTTDTTEQQISDYSYQDKSAALSLRKNTGLIDLSWNSYTVAQSGSAMALTLATTGTVTVFNGYYSMMTEVRQETYPSNFKSGLMFTINNQPAGSFIILPSNTISLGYSTQYIRIAASSSVATGLYNLQFTKTGDTAGYYTQFPPLTVVVQNTLCSLKTKEPTYTVPLNGFSLPIIIEALNCIPITSINIAFTSTSSEISVNPDLSNTQLSSSSPDGRFYIVLKHTAGTLTAGSIVTGTLTITGTNAASYGPIPTITITMIASSVVGTPSALALSNPTLTLNTATFNLQCTVASTIYWGLGIYPSILNTGALGFQARIVSEGTGLKTNFTEAQDYYWEVYGVEYVSIANQLLTKTVYGLKSNTNYLFKYFCINQKNNISEGQIIQFNSTDNGAYLMKILMTFNGPISYGQFNNLACSIAQNFVIPYSRVYTEAISYCGNTNTIFYAALTRLMLNAPNSNNQYIYNFYIIPDYSLQQDSTNLNIRQKLSQQSFSTQIITSTTAFTGLPTLIQMQTADVENLGSPTYTVNAIVSGLTGLTFNATITNMNGFVVFAIMDGVFLNTMTLPVATNLKQGLFQTGSPLLAVQMQYIPQNYNVSFTFSSLTQNKTYYIFHFATVDDPTLTALSSSVSVMNVSTLTSTPIDINWAGRFFIGLFILILSLL